MRRQRGSVLIIALITFVLASMVFMIVYQYTLQNTEELSQQELRIRAHYLARSGVDLAYAALMSAPSGGGYAKYIDMFKSNSANTLSDTKTFGEGTVRIQVTQDTAWVIITSEGQLNAAQGGNRVTLKFYINKLDYTVVRWE